MEFKKLWRPFLVIFFIAFLVINWNDISWVFNYKVISDSISNLFQKEKQSLSGESASVFVENKLEIPEIEVSAPLILSQSANENDLEEDLDKGVVLYPGYVFPGQPGQTVILGHSAPEGWPKINYDWVFSRLGELNEGDDIFVYFDGQEYRYHVVNMFFLERGEEIPEGDLTNSGKNALMLMTCWPPGKDLRRLVVEATL
jgi:LPXTG-site transpeptidase (sortase) family protein